MRKNKELQNLPTGGEGTICPTCRKGELKTHTALLGHGMTFECSICKTIFYRNSVDQLIEMGTKESIEEYKKYSHDKPS